MFSDRERRYPLGADLRRQPAVPAPGRDNRYPGVTLEEVAGRRSALVLLPDEPHEFSEADAVGFRGALPDARVVFCDGRDLMRYGLRSLEGLCRVAGVLGA